MTQVNVKYTGFADVRQLVAGDLAKAGVDNFRKTDFPKGEAVAVDAAVGKVLVEEDIFGEFEYATEDTELDLTKAEEPAKDAAPTEASQESTGPARVSKASAK